jgi:hypothetical protein
VGPAQRRPARRLERPLRRRLARQLLREPLFLPARDLADGSWQVRAPGIPLPSLGVYNTDATAVPAAAGLPWRWVMALETTAEAARFLASASADPTDAAAWALLDAAQVPLQYLSFQNAWWKSGGESAPWCVGEWEAVPSKVPMGIKAFQQALALPLQLYAPYFCASSAYPENFTMVRSDKTLPGCGDMDFYDAAPEDSRRFYQFLLGLGQDYGMTMFEPDFLNANHVCVPRFIEEVGAAATFFDGQTFKKVLFETCFRWRY